MRLYTDEKDKLLAVWLTREEHDDPGIMTALSPLFAQFKKRKYQPVIYRPGNGELMENTAALLCHTRRKMNETAS